MVVTIIANSKDVIPPQTRLKMGDMEHGPALPSLQSISFTGSRNPRTLTKSTGNPERIKYPRWRTEIWRKEIQSDTRAPRLRSKLKFIKIICLNKSDIAECMLSLFLIILFWQLSDPASQRWRARSQRDSLSCRSGLFWWLSGVRGWVLGSQLRLSKVETFPVLNLRNSKSWRTRNLDIIIAKNFRRIIDCVIRVIYYTWSKQNLIKVGNSFMFKVTGFTKVLIKSLLIFTWKNKYCDSNFFRQAKSLEIDVHSTNLLLCLGTPDL